VPDVGSIAPVDVRLWVTLDVHRLLIVAATGLAEGHKLEVCRIETTDKETRRFIERLGWS
jgi:hypothetical protein